MKLSRRLFFKKAAMKKRTPKKSPSDLLEEEIMNLVYEMRKQGVNRNNVYALLRCGARMWKQGSAANITPERIIMILNKQFAYIEAQSEN